MSELPHREAPVLLVPGAFGQDLLYWNLMQYLLEKDGFHVYTLKFPRFTLSDLRVSAHVLRNRVEEVAEAEGARQVHVVGHSMGGLIGRYYLKFLKGADRTKSLICLGSPHHGTWSALTGITMKGARQVLPGSQFLTRLNDPSRGHGGVPITNIWSERDVIVIPKENARLEVPGVTNRCARFAGHWGMLVSPGVYRWLLESLEASDGTGEGKPTAALRRMRAGEGRRTP